MGQERREQITGRMLPSQSQHPTRCSRVVHLTRCFREGSISQCFSHSPQGHGRDRIYLQACFSHRTPSLSHLQITLRWSIWPSLESQIPRKQCLWQTCKKRQAWEWMQTWAIPTFPPATTWSQPIEPWHMGAQQVPRHLVLQQQQ